ncbi:hypothetical protein I6F15_04485 [Bradyrhizobium sp. BRP14]|nr:hypothetical protein [Bradyrhizobium sp. BRP14]
MAGMWNPDFALRVWNKRRKAAGMPALQPEPPPMDKRVADAASKVSAADLAALIAEMEAAQK